MTTRRRLLSVEEYLAEVMGLVRPLAEVERVPLREAAGRTLAEPVTSRGQVPAFDNSAMDGFAIRHDDLSAGAVLRVVGDVAAGSTTDPAFGQGQCVRIMTGAPLPSVADTVVPVELTEAVEGGVRFADVVPRGAHVRRAGEDVSAGDVVLDAGVRLGARTLSAVAAAGRDSVPCVRRPWVGVVATGDELVPAGGSLGRGQIFESNGTFLGAAVARDGATPLVAPLVGDDPDALRTVLDGLAARCDLVVLSGGVSVGDHDVTRQVLEAAGAEFRHVRVQPGKPQGWARWPAGDRQVPVVGLPGNPLSAAVSYEMFVAPLLDRLMDRPSPGWTTAVAGAGWRSPAGRRQLVPVLLDVDADARQVVRPAHRRGSASHMVTSLAHADALASVPEDVTEVAPGDLLAIRRLA